MENNEAPQRYSPLDKLIRFCLENKLVVFLLLPLGRFKDQVRVEVGRMRIKA